MFDLQWNLNFKHEYFRPRVERKLESGDKKNPPHAFLVIINAPFFPYDFLVNVPIIYHSPLYLNYTFGKYGLWRDFLFNENL